MLQCSLRLRSKSEICRKNNLPEPFPPLKENAGPWPCLVIVAMRPRPSRGHRANLIQVRKAFSFKTISEQMKTIISPQLSHHGPNSFNFRSVRKTFAENRAQFNGQNVKLAHIVRPPA